MTSCVMTWPLTRWTPLGPTAGPKQGVVARYSTARYCVEYSLAALRLLVECNLSFEKVQETIVRSLGLHILPGQQLEDRVPCGMTLRRAMDDICHQAHKHQSGLCAQAGAGAIGFDSKGDNLGIIMQFALPMRYPTPATPPISNHHLPPTPSRPARGPKAASKAAACSASLNYPAACASSSCPPPPAPQSVQPGSAFHCCLGFVHLESHDAEHQCAKLIECLKAAGYWTADVKILFAVCDSAASNVGKHSGVVMRLAAAKIKAGHQHHDSLVAPAQQHHDSLAAPAQQHLSSTMIDCLASQVRFLVRVFGGYYTMRMKFLDELPYLTAALGDPSTAARQWAASMHLRYLEREQLLGHLEGEEASKYDPLELHKMTADLEVTRDTGMLTPAMEQLLSRYYRATHMTNAVPETMLKQLNNDSVLRMNAACGICCSHAHVQCLVSAYLMLWLVELIKPLTWERFALLYTGRSHLHGHMGQCTFVARYSTARYCVEYSLAALRLLVECNLSFEKVQETIVRSLGLHILPGQQLEDRVPCGMTLRRAMDDICHQAHKHQSGLCAQAGAGAIGFDSKGDNLGIIMQFALPMRYPTPATPPISNHHLPPTPSRPARPGISLFLSLHSPHPGSQGCQQGCCLLRVTKLSSRMRQQQLPPSSCATVSPARVSIPLLLRIRPSGKP
ncbi:hypothetical protein V8C86DRAFT_3028885 [Haematococcus lacustris]